MSIVKPGRGEVYLKNGDAALNTPGNNPSVSLYRRLDSIGVKSSYVRAKLLPPWWDDEAASTPAGYAELAMLLARRVNLPVTALLDGSASLSYAPDDGVKFKLASGVDRSKLTVTQHLATQVAQAAIPGMRTPFRGVRSALALRDAILQRPGSVIDLEGLLEYCWVELGVPVLPVSTFPAGCVKMDGLTTNVDGRPVIVISKASAQTAWPLFILAHEVGHIGSGHVGPNQTLVDSDFRTQAEDAEEAQANAYALSLLRGVKAKLVERRKMKAETLLGNAKELGKAQRIDPGHLILSYAREKGASDKAGGNFWGVANKALGMLTPNADAPKIMRRKLLQHLDWSSVSDDVAEYIRRMTCIDDDA